MATQEQLSPRLTALKQQLVNAIPASPANRATLAAKPLTDVLIQYLTWKARGIRPRPRQVVVWPEVTGSPHYPTYTAAIARIKEAFERGDDMNPYLSHLVRRNGYAGDLPPRSASMTQEEWVKKAWRGKDRVRVTVDAHHLHMGPLKSDGSVDRTGELLFVGIAKDQAFFLTIGDHDSFDDGTVSSLMADKLDAQLAQAGGGAALAGPAITTAGTQVADTFKAIDLVKTLKALDGSSPPDHRFRIEWDDLVVEDSTGAELHRLTGAL